MNRELRGALAALYNSRAPEVLVEGRAGTSKTTGILTKIIDLCDGYPGSRHLVCRQTRASCTESVMVTLERLLQDSHPHIVGSGAARENRHSYTWHNGSTIVLGGLDQPERLFSTEWDTVYVAEATETTEDAWEKFGRAMRNNRVPYQQRIADCNPSAPGHWLNKRATGAPDYLRDANTPQTYDRLQRFNYGNQDGRMQRLISVHQDNPGYWSMEPWGWTDTGRQYVLGQLATLTGHRKARLFDGRWKAAEGTVFPEFDDARHVIHPFAVPLDWPQFVGIDPGYDHPCAILWVAVAPNGCFYIVDELYRGGLSVSRHAADIRARNPGRTVLRYYADPQHAFSQTAQSPKSIASQFKEAGISVSPWPRSTDKESMVEAVRKRLEGDRLKIFATCPNTITEFQTWSYKRTARGEVPSGDDAYEDANNHALDVVCGLVALNLKYGGNQVRVLEER